MRDVSQRLGASLPFVVLVSLALLAVGCPRRVPSPTEALEQAAADARDGSSVARTLALAGFHAWLIEGDFAAAAKHFERSAELDPTEPYALVGLQLAARRAAHPARALGIALDLLERAPDHPLASLAARYVLESVDTAPALDEQIHQRATKVIAAGIAGEAGQLLRTALISIAHLKGDAKALGGLRAAGGMPELYTLVGPLSAFDTLDFDTTYPAETSGDLSGPFDSPSGKLAPRVLPFPDGRASLQGESVRGDVYLVAADFDVVEPGTYVVRAVASVSHKLYLDGALLGGRREFDRVEPSVLAVPVKLAAGRHRLLTKALRDERSGALALAVFAAKPGIAAPKFVRAQGRAASWAGVEKPARPVEGVFPRAESLAEALTPEVGRALAGYLAIRDGMGRDIDGAKALLVEVGGHFAPGTLAGTRAEVSLADGTLPSKTSRGRATRDLEVALAADPSDVGARLRRASIALEDDRAQQAAELLEGVDPKRATAPVLLLQARVALALGVEPQAETLARAALTRLPGLCQANLLLYDLARRRTAVEATAALLEPLAACSDAQGRRADFLRARGELEEALVPLEAMVARQPALLGPALTLANHHVSLRRYDDAFEVLDKVRAYWPRNVTLLKRMADAKELAGKREEALALREEALTLDGGDLALRRSVERVRTGEELLEEFAVDGRAAIASYEKQRIPEEATAVYVLDAAAVRVYPDGSLVNRIHTIQKALEQDGVQEIAEVNLPQGAQVLNLRTIKADGTVLEPEQIEGKDSVSLPAVQVGDYVEAEYLLAESARSMAQPGFTAATFYFQIARQPNHWTKYVVLAPAEMKTSVDAHNLPNREVEIQRRGELDFVYHEERDVPPYIPEPNAPPSMNEYMPFIVVGAGATGNDELVRVYGDAFLRRAQRSFEVERFARESVGELTGVDAVRALHAAVIKRIQGRDAGLGAAAGSTLAQDRGSRMLLLKAALESIGIPARLALVRSFSADPAPYRFPNSGLLPYACLRAELPGGEKVWLDTGVRFAPFGELPEQARGREAFVMPEPGRPLEKDTTPAGAEVGKTVSLTLTLTENGELSGEGVETYRGFEGAQLSEALEGMSPDGRSQALQGALGRYFGGAELSRVDVKTAKEVGETLVVSYAFKAPNFARRQGNRLVLGPLTFPANLGRRYVKMGARNTPLYIDSSEVTTTTVTLTVPAGFVQAAPISVDLPSAKGFGAFARKQTQRGSVLTIEERFRIEMARIMPPEYAAFAKFAGEVDLVQLRDLVLETK